MPSIEVTDEELQGFITLCATASGPGINWMLTNALLTKARLAQEAHRAALNPDPSLFQAKPGDIKRVGNSEDHDAAVAR